MNTLVFDIETIPDTDFGRRHYNLDGLDDNSVAKVMYFKQRQAQKTDFLPLVQYRIVVVSALLPGERLRWWHVSGALLGLTGPPF